MMVYYRKKLVILLFMATLVISSFGFKPPLKGRADLPNVLIIEIKGMTFEMMERAYTPNIKFLIKNGFLGSMKYKNPEEPSTGISMNFRRKLGTMAMCMDSMKVCQTSLNTVGAFNESFKGPFSKIRKNYRSNESMVKDFINNSNGTNVRFAMLSFRAFTQKQGFVDEGQIRELSTIDSLIGVVFKSYQEKVKWEQTTVFIVSDGSAAHEYRESELYKNTPIVIKGPGIPIVYNVENVVSTDDVLGLVNKIMEVPCKDNFIPLPVNFLEDIGKDEEVSGVKTYFVSRPDIHVHPIPSKNSLKIEVFDDNESSVMYYTIDGSDPRTRGFEYKSPITIREAGTYTIKAAANKNGVWSPVTQEKTSLRFNITSIELDPEPDAKYFYDGTDELIDGDTAGLSYSEEKWLGFQGTDVDMLFNFGSKREIRSVDLSALQDYYSWIFLPVRVTFFAGNDRNHLVEIGTVSHAVDRNDVTIRKLHYSVIMHDALLKSLGGSIVKKKKGKRSLYVKYLRIKVEAQKVAPEWFSLPGAQVWFFTDEVRIE